MAPVDRTVVHGVEENRVEMFSMNVIDLAIPLAQESAPGMLQLLIQHLIAATVFAALGIIVFFVGLLIVEKITPFSIIKEILDEHNQAVAMIISAVVLGISIIVAAAIVG